VDEPSKPAHLSVWNRSLRLSRNISRQLKRKLVRFPPPPVAVTAEARNVIYHGKDPKSGNDVTIKMDSMSLLYHLPAEIVSTRVLIHQGKMIPGTRPTPYHAEFRGDMVLLRHAGEEEWGSAIGDGFDAVFCVKNCAIQLQHRRLRIRREKRAILMVFQTDAEAKDWEKVLCRSNKQEQMTFADFKVISPVGKGAVGMVFLVQQRATKRYYALKVIEKASKVFYSENAFRHLVDERLVLERVRAQPGFATLRYAFQSRTHFYLVTDFYEGGDLCNYLFMRQGALEAHPAQMIMAEVILAMEFLHAAGILYRDLKPENILIDANGHAVLADFGLCKYFPEGLPQGRTDSICGTPNYVAPEMVVEKKYGRSVDVYTLGVLLYHILMGRPPFKLETNKSIRTNVRQRSKPRFDDKVLTRPAVELLKNLMDDNPEARLGVAALSLNDVKKSKFFSDLNWAEVYRRQNSGLGLEEPEDEIFDEEAHLLRNFQTTEWSNIRHVDDSVDPTYGEANIWPICPVTDFALEAGFLPGFSFVSD